MEERIQDGAVRGEQVVANHGWGELARFAPGRDARVMSPGVAASPENDGVCTRESLNEGGANEPFVRLAAATGWEQDTPVNPVY